MDKLPRLPWALGLWVEKIDLSKHLADLLVLEEACFPQAMRDTEQVLRDMFQDGGLFGLILYSKGIPIATLSGERAASWNTPSEALLLNFEDSDRQVFYMDNICVHPDHRSNVHIGFLFQEMKVRILPYFDFVSGAARVDNGWSHKLQKAFGAIVLERFDDWQQFSEPFDYVLIDLNRVPQSPKWLRAIQVFIGILARLRYRRGNNR